MKQNAIFTTSTIMPSAESEIGNDASQSDTDCNLGKAEFDDFDGKQAWVVVTAAACSLFVYLGVLYSWGVMQVRLLETSSTSLTTLMFIGSLASSFMVSVSIPAGLVVQRIGYRMTALTGAMMMGLGEFLASWLTHHVEALFIVHGVMFGMGGGLSIFAVSTAPIRWFRKHRGLSMGIVLGGGSVGSAVMSVVTTVLVKHVDVAWTFRILGFLLWAVCIPSAFLIRPPPGSDNSHLQLQWFRFRDFKFLILLLGTACATFPLFIPPYFIPIFARTVTSWEHAAVLGLAVWNVASTIGRVGAGHLSDCLLGPMNSLVLCLLLTGLSMLVVWPFASSMAVLMCFIVLNGIGCGAFFSLVPVVLGSAFGATNVLGTIPLIWTTWFFGFFFGSPIGSGLYSLAGRGDSVEAYRPAAYYGGAMSLMGMLFILAVRLMQNKTVFTKV
ncbi:Monoacylglycerol lipase ABHD12 [Verticillium dahliae VDG2]|nr:Monoacylglycerol lipase ABHD12 [Verticillium dahliae VDG2]